MEMRLKATSTDGRARQLCRAFGLPPAIIRVPRPGTVKAIMSAAGAVDPLGSPPGAKAKIGPASHKADVDSVRVAKRAGARAPESVPL